VPALPWTSHAEVAPDTEVTVMGSRLPLASPLFVPSFLGWTLRIRRQLAHADGLVGYALDAHLLQRTFWTVSAWRSRRHLAAFHRADPHHTAVARIHPHMRPSTFVTWTCPASALPIGWDEVRRRVEAEVAGSG
jgi:hypothetical protein